MKWICQRYSLEEVASLFYYAKFLETVNTNDAKTSALNLRTHSMQNIKLL